MCPGDTGSAGQDQASRTVLRWLLPHREGLSEAKGAQGSKSLRRRASVGPLYPPQCPGHQQHLETG